MASMIADPDHREEIAHIDRMLARAERKRHEITLAPWAIALVGAALAAVGAAFMQVFGD